MGQPKIVLLSGPICSGKSALAQRLADRFALQRIKTSDFIKKRSPKKKYTRKIMQDLGQRLDNQFGGDWLLKDTVGLISDSKTGVIIDSVRTEKQIEVFRNAYLRKVIHVHIDAPEEIRAQRYAERLTSYDGEFEDYHSTQRNRTERNIPKLGTIADISLDTSRCTQQDVLERVASLLGLYGNAHDKLVDVLIGGQYGSEGKGNIVSYIAPEYDYLVRVGGPNAGHVVKINDNSEYTFRQLPSGTAACNSKLVIGPGAVINVSILLQEIYDHKVGIDRLYIDPNAMIISNNDIAFESKGLKGDISSTASGTGCAAARRILFRGKPYIKLAKDEPELQYFLKPSLEVFEDAYRDGSKILLEGTQGTGLSLYHGYYPHVTSRDTTVAGCLAEAGISAIRVRKIIMVCRTYPIRVPNSGAGNTSGPMSENVTREEVSRRSSVPLDDLKELTSVTKGKRRIGEFDWHLLHKSKILNSPTDIALTFADYLDIKNRKARRYEQLTEDTIKFIEEVERFASAPVSLISTRFHLRSVIDRRSWR